MFFFDLFRSFLPLRNPIGFGASDFIEFTVTALLVLCALLWNPFVRRHVAVLAEKTPYCMLVLAALPVALRLLLLPNHPVPTPAIYDEFSHFLVADTLLHFRLANPPHPFHQFFETFFVLQSPTYSSIYSLGQGMTLAFGRLISGCAWTGVALSVAAFCASTYWMLRGWTTPALALLGGLLAVIEFGPLNIWMNSYYGGAFAATAGCLVFGALPRLLATGRRRDAAVLGIGFGMHLLTRQFESVLLLASIFLYFALMLRSRAEFLNLRKAATLSILAVVPAIALTLAQNKAVTNSWTTLPEQLSQYQYGVPTTLTIQSIPIPHHQLTPEQQLDYKAQSLTHGNGTDTLARFLLRLEYRIRYYRFFFLPALYPAIIAFLFALRERRFVWVIGTLAIFALGTNLFPYLLVHYLAAVACLFILVSVIGLRQLSQFTLKRVRIGAEAARLIVFVCAAHFVFWYGLHLFENEQFSRDMEQYETWDTINHGNSDRRLEINRRLSALPGKQLVFVRYWPQHIYRDEWVWNAADIDASRIVFARYLSPAENSQLCRYYPDRTVWLLEPDFRPPRLTRYSAGSD